MGNITASATQLKPDGKYKSILASKFINCMMYDGKKSVAQKVFYDALDIVKEKLGDKDPIEVFHSAVEIVKPPIEAGGGIIDVMVLTESVLVGVALVCIKFGRDNTVLDVMFEAAKNRLAEIRLRDIPTGGSS